MAGSGWGASSDRRRSWRGTASLLGQRAPVRGQAAAERGQAELHEAEAARRGEAAGCGAVVGRPGGGAGGAARRQGSRGRGRWRKVGAWDPREEGMARATDS